MLQANFIKQKDRKKQQNSFCQKYKKKICVTMKNPLSLLWKCRNWISFGLKFLIVLKMEEKALCFLSSSSPTRFQVNLQFITANFNLTRASFYSYIHQKSSGILVLEAFQWALRLKALDACEGHSRSSSINNFSLWKEEIFPSKLCQKVNSILNAWISRRFLS